MRSKEELLDAVVRTRFLGFAPRAAASVGSWKERAFDLHLELRAWLLERRKLLFTPAFRRILPYAFMQAGMEGRSLLKEAGFASETLVRASRALYWHTMGFVLHEAASTQSTPPTTTPQLVRDGIIEALKPEDFAVFVKNLPQWLAFDSEAVFKYSLGCFLAGLEKELARTTGNRKSRR